jgi:hypothetical protein
MPFSFIYNSDYLIIFMGNINKKAFDDKDMEQLCRKSHKKEFKDISFDFTESKKFHVTSIGMLTFSTGKWDQLE